MNIELGRRYKTRNGNHIIKIITNQPDNISHTYMGVSEATKEQWYYTAKGEWDNDGHENKWDLVSEVAEEKTAVRHNVGKPRMSLLPGDALEWEAAVWTAGAAKYSIGNWQKLWGDETHHVVMDSLLRHAAAILRGEINDPETGLPHAAHIRCNAAMMIRYHGDKNGPQG